MAKRKAAKSAGGKAKLKKVPGKSTAKQAAVPAYKPTMYFDGKQIPKGLESAKPGTTATVTAKVKVVRRSEGVSSRDANVIVELDKMAVQSAKGGKKALHALS